MWLWCVGERGRKAVCDARVFLGEDAVSAQKLNQGNPLVILGVMVELQPDGLKAPVAPDKAEKWAVGVRRALDEERLSQSDATRLGGRMNFLNANAFGRRHALGGRLVSALGSDADVDERCCGPSTLNRTGRSAAQG